MNYIRRPSSDVIKTGQQHSLLRTCGHSSNLGHADTPYPGHANDSRNLPYSIPVLEVAPYACNMRRLVTESAPGLCHQTQRMPCNQNCPSATGPHRRSLWKVLGESIACARKLIEKLRVFIYIYSLLASLIILPFPVCFRCLASLPTPRSTYIFKWIEIE